jgi:ABC-type branched-subunit amino acid transport system ATPase component
MIRSVGLVEKRNEKSAGLSGGQKRKLSVGIAFIGGSRVIFLDEVSSANFNCAHLQSVEHTLFPPPPPV